MINNIFEKMKKYKKLLAFLIIGIIIIFFAKVLYQNFLELPDYDWQINYFSLAISYLLLVFHFVIIALIWRSMLKKLDPQKISLKKLFTIVYLPYLGKYVPGVIWSAVGRVYLSQKIGLAKKSAVIATVWEQIIALVSGVLLFTVSLFFWGRFEEVNYLFIIIFALFLLLISLNPSLFTRLVNFALRKFGQPNLVIEANFSSGTILKFMGFYCFVWSSFSLSFYFFVNSIYSIAPSYFLLLLGMYPAAWTLGVLTFLTPGGIGVTEGILTAFLALYLPLPVAIIISLSSRIWLATAELICSGLAAILSSSNLKNSLKFRNNPN